MADKIHVFKQKLYKKINKEGKESTLQNNRQLDDGLMEFHSKIDGKVMKNIQRLTSKENQVMKYLWKNKLAVRKVKVISKIKELYKSGDEEILEIIESLEEKKYIEGYFHIDNEKYYKVLIPKNLYNRILTEEFYKDVHRGAFKSLISSLEASKDIDLEELIEIFKIYYGGDIFDK